MLSPVPRYELHCYAIGRLGKSMPVSRLRVTSLPTLVSSVLELQDQLTPSSFLWFRGLSCTCYSLLPKLMRENKPADDVFERERRLLTRFRQRSMAYWPAGHQQDDWEHLFAMQHYGLPTRLLDWSENLFVAAYFALISTRDANHGHDRTPVIWSIDPVMWNRAMPGLSEYGDTIHVLTTADEELQAYETNTNRRRSKSPVAIYGTHNSDRIVAQRGTFMVWGNDSRPLEQVADEHERATLWCFELDGDSSILFEQLQLLGFSETMVFPELSYLAAELGRVEGWRA